jgi:uncharacterized membrane protein YfcA
MEWDWQFFAFAIPATVFAGVSKAGFGSGAAFAAGAILAMVLDPGLALGVMLPLLMLVDVASLRPYWRRWDGRAALALILGAAPGVALGALLFSMVNDDAIRLLIGAMCLAFVAFQFARSQGWISAQPRPFRAGAGGLAGLVAGFTSFVSHAGGPPVAVFMLSQSMSKTAYQATTVIVFWAINLMKFLPYAYLGIFSWDTLKADLVLAPFAILGAFLGVRAHHAISEKWFFGFTYVALVITGVRLIWLAL